MRGSTAAPSFSAALTPTGVYLVAYRSVASGVEVTDSVHEKVGPSDPAVAARTLARLVEARRGRGATLDLAVSGFGSYNQILTLPRAPREVLLPVITRELRRFYPPVFAADDDPPLVEYAPIRPGRPSGEDPQMNFLAAAVPRSLISAVRQELLACGVSLTHWTVLPRVMQRLYHAFGGSDLPTAAVVLADGLSVLGFFEAGDLRLFSETPRDDEVEASGSAVVDRIERGSLYLRQQFAGASVRRVLLSTASADTAETMYAAVAERLGVRPEPFGPYSGTPGALLALGAALDAAAPDRLQLLPPGSRSARPAERWSRMLYAASIAMIVAASAWWAGSAVAAERDAAERLARAESALESRAQEFAGTREVVEERRAHTHRSELLHALLDDRGRLPELLWQISAPGTNVRVDQVELYPRGSGWAGAIEGTAAGTTSGRSTAAVDAFYQSLRGELPAAEITLDRLSPRRSEAPGWTEVGDLRDPIATTFRMSFIVPSVPVGIR